MRYAYIVLLVVFARIASGETGATPVAEANSSLSQLALTVATVTAALAAVASSAIAAVSFLRAAKQDHRNRDWEQKSIAYRAAGLATSNCANEWTGATREVNIVKQAFR